MATVAEDHTTLSKRGRRDQRASERVGEGQSGSEMGGLRGSERAKGVPPSFDPIDPLSDPQRPSLTPPTTSSPPSGTLRPISDSLWTPPTSLVPSLY